MISFFGRKIFVYFILFFSLASGVSGGEKEMGAGLYSIVIMLLIFFWYWLFLLSNHRGYGKTTGVWSGFGLV